MMGLNDWTVFYILNVYGLYNKGLIKDYRIAWDAGNLILTFINSKHKSKHIFMQLNHSESGSNKILGDRELKARDGKYSITKYFKLYQDIKQIQKYKIKDITHIILYTNIDMPEDVMKDFKEKKGLHEILKSPADQAKFYRFKNECVQNYLKCSSNDDERKEFEARFLIAISKKDKKYINTKFNIDIEKSSFDYLLEELIAWNNMGYFIDHYRFKSIKIKYMSFE